MKASMESVRRDVMVPFASLKRHTAKLARVHAATSLLRRVRRVRYSIGKLRTLLGDQSPGDLDSRQLAKVAQVLVEIDRVTLLAGPDSDAAGGDLSRIPQLEAEMRWVAGTKQGVRTATLSLLSNAMATLGQAELASALQIFHDLRYARLGLTHCAGGADTPGCLLTLPMCVVGLDHRCLPDRVDAAVKRCVHQVDRAASDTFSPSSLRGSAGQHNRRQPGGVRGSLEPPAGSASAWRTALWAGLDTLMDRLYRASVQVWHLQRVLAKKRDTSSHVPLLEVVRSAGSESPYSDGLFPHFWSLVTQALKEKVCRVVWLGGW